MSLTLHSNGVTVIYSSNSLMELHHNKQLLLTEIIILKSQTLMLTLVKNII